MASRDSNVTGSPNLNYVPSAGDYSRPVKINTDIPISISLTAQQFADDAALRLGSYVPKARQIPPEVIEKFLGKFMDLESVLKLELQQVKGMNLKAAANLANAQRNALVKEIRDQTSPLARLIAEKLKPLDKLPQTDQIVNSKMAKAAGRGAPISEEEALLGVIKSAGSANRWVNRLLVTVKYAGPALLVVSISFSIYNVATAPPEQRWGIAIHEAGAWAGGMIGFRAGIALAPVACEGGAYAGGALVSWTGVGIPVGAAAGCGVGAVGAIGIATFTGAWAGGRLAEDSYDYVIKWIIRS